MAKEMDLARKVKVWNRATGTVGYELPDLRISRVWVGTGNLQMVSVEELEALRYLPGGANLMNKYLLVKDQDVCEFLGMNTDPEYFYDENDIKVLLDSGTMDQLLDCLEFAPTGVLDLLKKTAVDTKLDSAEKRKAISEHLKVNIDSMIKNNEDFEVDSAETTVRQRRSTPIKAEEKVAPVSKYNVVKKG